MEKELQEILNKLEEKPELYNELLNTFKTKERLVNSRAEDMKFWVITSNPLQVFTDKDEAITEMQYALVEDPACSVAAIAWLEKESKFDVNPVPHSEINVVLSKRAKESNDMIVALTKKMKELEDKLEGKDEGKKKKKKDENEK